MRAEKTGRTSRGAEGEGEASQTSVRGRLFKMDHPPGPEGGGHLGVPGRGYGVFRPVEKRVEFSSGHQSVDDRTRIRARQDESEKVCPSHACG